MRNDPFRTEPDDHDPETARALVAEAFHTFSEAAARQLAVLLEVDFEECAEDIARLRYRLH